MAAAPMWYRVIQAARYLGVEPWTLQEQAYSWVRMAEEAQAAEAHAEEARRSPGKHRRH